MLPSNVALVATPDEVDTSELTAVAAALQVQANRDFGPLWNVSATVVAFTKLEDVPVGHWPIVVQRTIDNPDAEGYHTDHNQQPIAFVKYADNWTLVASHEMVEMLADPFGRRLVPGPSVDPDPQRSADRVQYLVEACDPVQDPQFAYTINGITVADFITPQYHDPAGTSGARYDFKGAITAPRQVLANGYISWQDPVVGAWFQMTFFNGLRDVESIGLISGADAALSPREVLHARGGGSKLHRPPIPDIQKRALDRVRAGSIAASEAHAARLKTYLAGIEKTA